MKNIVMLAFLAFSFVQYCKAQAKLKGNGEVVTVSEEIRKNFDQLEISDNLVVELSQGSRNSYTLSTDENLVDAVEITVEANTLKIRTNKKITGSKELKIQLEVKKLKHVQLKDDARLQTNETLKVDDMGIDANNSAKFDLEIEASGNLRLVMYKNSGGKLKVKSKHAEIEMHDRTDLKADSESNELKVSMENSAELQLDGKADHAEYRLESSSALKARKMKTRIAEIFSRNRSDIYVHASKKLEVTAEGKSQVYVYGHPDIELKGLTDSSRIIKK
ncbi:MAG: head GIN domain-containing protein [Salegentibacter sp.]